MDGCRQCVRRKRRVAEPDCQRCETRGRSKHTDELFFEVEKRAGMVDFNAPKVSNYAGSPRKCRCSNAECFQLGDGVLKKMEVGFVDQLHVRHTEVLKMSGGTGKNLMALFKGVVGEEQ